MFFGGEFPPFCKHEKGPSTSTNDFFNLKNQNSSIVSEKIELYNGLLDM